jgi:hypothetical protein
MPRIAASAMDDFADALRRGPERGRSNAERAGLATENPYGPPTQGFDFDEWERSGNPYRAGGPADREALLATLDQSAADREAYAAQRRNGAAGVDRARRQPEPSDRAALLANLDQAAADREAGAARRRGGGGRQRKAESTGLQRSAQEEQARAWAEGHMSALQAMGRSGPSVGPGAARGAPAPPPAAGGFDYGQWGQQQQAAMQAAFAAPGVRVPAQGPPAYATTPPPPWGAGAVSQSEAATIPAPPPGGDFGRALAMNQGAGRNRPDPGY